MSWQAPPPGPAGSGPAGSGPEGPGPGSRPESASEREERIAWQKGGSSLFPRPARLADRITTVLLLVFGALLTILVGIVAVIAVIAASSSCDAVTGCSRGAMIGGGSLAVGGAFVFGVAAVVLSIAAWLRRRPSWWIAAVGFVLALGCVVAGGVVFADAADHSGQSTQYSPFSQP